MSDTKPVRPSLRGNLGLAAVLAGASVVGADPVPPDPSIDPTLIEPRAPRRLRRRERILTARPDAGDIFMEPVYMKIQKKTRRKLMGWARPVRCPICRQKTRQRWLSFDKIRQCLSCGSVRDERHGWGARPARVLIKPIPNTSPVVIGHAPPRAAAGSASERRGWLRRAIDRVVGR